MYPTSAAYKTAIVQSTREVKITGTITLKDSTVINISDEDVLQGSLYLTKQCVSGEDIEVGNVYASELGLALTSPPLNPYSLDGARIIINFGLNVEPDPEEDPSWEYVPLGYFYVTEIERKQTTVNLKALDGLIFFDVDLSSVLTTGTPYAIVSSCCTKAGVTLATDFATFAAFANGTSSFTLPADSKVETCRDLIMWICQLTGTFARMNRAGQLEVVPITSGASVKTISKPERFTSDVSDFEVKITQVAMKVGETEYSQGTDGMTMVLEENPLLVGAEAAVINTALTNLLNQITLAEYTPYNVDFAGDPALQPGDWITLSDTGVLGGGDVVSIVTHTSWRYRGACNLKGVGKSGLIRGVQAQQNKTVSSIAAIVKAAQDLAQAANQSTQLINDAIGGHILIRREPGGTNEILIMDSEDPDLANKIWRWNMGGLGYSDNCVGADNPARQYGVAMTMDGAINASFIKTGILSTIELDAVYGTFESLMAGVAGAARIELGADSGNPFLKMYDSSGLRINQTKEAIEFYHSGTLAAFIKANTVSGYTDLYIDATRSVNITPRLKLYETHPAYGNMVEHYPGYSEWLNIRQSDLVVLRRGIVGFSDSNFNIDSEGNILKLKSTGGIKVRGDMSPDVNDSYYLGLSAYRWKGVYGVVADFSGAATFASTLAFKGGTIDGYLTPASTAKVDSGMYGLYSASRIGHIWSMGTAYKISATGADFGSLYGLAYKHTNNPTGGTMAGGHQMVWCQNGTPYSAMGTNIWTSGDVIFKSSTSLYDTLLDQLVRIVLLEEGKISASSFGTTSSYVRYANGLQICWGYTSRTTTIATQWGGCYHSSNWTITFPAAFSHIMAFSGMTYRDSRSAWLIEDGAFTTGTGSSVTVVFMRPVSLSSSTTLYYTWMAIGRWK